jgi:hypothetical protein
MENPNSSQMSAIIALYDLQTTLFRNALDGITDDDAHKRLDTKANHIAWMAGSLVAQRFYAASQLEIDQKMQGEEFFKDNKGIQDGVTYPTLDTYREDWTLIAPLLRTALLTISDEQLEKKILMGPDMTISMYELITFCSYREASMIGQIALWRRLLDYPAMKYM